MVDEDEDLSPRNKHGSTSNKKYWWDKKESDSYNLMEQEPISLLKENTTLKALTINFKTFDIFLIMILMALTQ